MVYIRADAAVPWQAGSGVSASLQRRSTMVTGTLRTVLWVLGGIAVAWLLTCLAMLPAMSHMMGSGMMEGMHEGATGGGMMGDMGMGSMMTMMAMMAVQFVVMLALAGVFVYLVLDSLRGRRSRPQR